MAEEILGFDKAQRLHICRALLERVLPVRSGPAEPPAVLDLGGYPAILAEWLAPHRAVVTVDRPECNAPGYVRASGDRLPFRDGAFRAAVSNDVLEHIPADCRAGFLSEMARVSSEWVLLAGPFDFPWVREGEALLTATIRIVMGRTNPWLDEHAACGLPDLAATRTALEHSGFTTAVAQATSLYSWALVKHIDYLAQAIPDAFDQAREANEIFGRDWAAGDHHPPTYRHVILAHRRSETLREFLKEPRPLLPGIRFAPPGEEPPAPDPAEVDRALALCRVLGGLARSATSAFSPVAGGASFEVAYTRRLETILEGHEEDRRRRDAEMEDLRRKLAAYEGSRLVALWRRLRS